MRYLKSLLLFFMIMSLLLVTVMIIAVTGGYFYLHHLKPQYAGEVTFIAVSVDNSRSTSTARSSMSELDAGPPCT